MSESIEQCIRKKAYNLLCLHRKDYMPSDLYSAIARSSCREAATACTAHTAYSCGSGLRCEKAGHFARAV